MRAEPVRSRNSHQKTQTDGRNAQRAVRSHSYIGLSEPKRELLKDIQESDLNGQLTIWGILPTIYDSRKAHHKEVLQALRYKYGEEVYHEPSRETTKYNDATVLKTDVSTLDKALAVYWDSLAATLMEGRRVQ